LIEAVFQLLHRFDGIISESQIRHTLGITSKQDIGALRELLSTDKRFEDSPENKWKCVPIEELIEDKPLKEVSFVITDIETTGSIRGLDRIIEIAAIKTRNGDILDRFESLVNPHKNISKQISKLTKITNSTVKDSPPIEEVLPSYIDFVDNGLFVAHNSLFDFCFINAEIRRLKLDSLKNQTDICTYRIAKKLLPNVRARGVNGLSLYFDYPIKNRHRAMPDVVATHYFLNKFLEQLESLGVNTLHKLIEFQKDKLGKTELKKKLKKQRKKNRYSRFRAF
jgi:DNA polymerase III epsilon subunit family exonuclease